ncbi:MAG: hypothetical protein U1E73_10225 [Planctomycetota bacterium]
MSGAPRRLLALPWALLCAAPVLGGALAAAWISDDGLVTLRTVENLAAGDGFRWNLAERTQTATHPLWILVAAAARWLSGELYATVIALSLACSVFAAWRIARRARTVATALAVVPIAMLCSRTFVDFATGGLENPLVYALAALFVDAWFDDDAPRARRLRRLATLGGLLVLARIDLVLLFAPCVLAAARGLRWREIVVALVPGTALLLAWAAFALVYFGTVVPTPGYGKALALDVPALELLRQGGRYLVDLGWRDPAAALALAALLVLAAARRTALWLAPAAGLVLQTAYTLRVGGDFMAGRFFSAALVFALAVLARGLARAPAIAFAAACVGGTLLAPGRPPWLDVAPPQAATLAHDGIGDERAFWAGHLALWSGTRDWPAYGAFTAPLVAAGRTRPMVGLFHAVGDPGMRAGPLVHVVEPFICDPLLTRLPIADPQHWRVGHYKRRIPEGYLETLATGENRLHHAGLARYYETLRTVLRAPLFAPARLAAMWKLWTGGGDADLRAFVADEYRSPPLVEVDGATLSPAVAPGTFWFDVAAAVVVREGGVRVRLPAALAGATLTLTADGSGNGAVRFLRAGSAVGEAPLALATFGARGLAIPVPETARGADAFEIHLATAAQRPDELAVAVLPVFALLAVQ